MSRGAGNGISPADSWPGSQVDGRLRSLSAAASVLLVTSAVLVFAYAMHAQFVVGGHGLDGFFQKFVNDLVVLTCAAVCLLRAWADRCERLAWTMLGLGMTSWALGNVYYSIYVINLHPLPIPSVADGLWLGIYPFSYVGVVLLVRTRGTLRQVGMWLDGVICATAVAAVSADVVISAVASSGGSSTAGVVTNLAYPVGDLVLLALVVGALALGGWRVDRTWIALSGGVVAFTVTDGAFLVKSAEGTYQVGTVIDAGWLLAALLVALAAWQPFTSGIEPIRNGLRRVLVPASFAIVAIALLADSGGAWRSWTVALATMTLLGVLARLALTFRECTLALDAATQSDARRAAILGAALDAIVTMDSSGRIVEWNPAAERIFGLDSGQAVGRMVADTIMPWYSGDVGGGGGYPTSFFEASTDSLIGRRVQVDAMRADERVFPAELAMTAVEANGERLFTAHIRDASERVEAERALRESEQQRLTSMLHAEQAERARIAVELHDDTVQVMTATLLALDRATRACLRADNAAIEQAIAGARTTLGEAIDRTRRLMFELHPTILHEQGVFAAVTVLAEQTARETGATVVVRGRIGRHPATIEALVYRTIREALANARKHADPHVVTLTLRERPDRVIGIVEDDGHGFDAAEVRSRPRSALHFGLNTTAERIRAAGGTMEVSSAPGHGTHLRFTVLTDRDAA